MTTKQIRDGVMKMFIKGEWVDRKETMEVRNPFNNEVIDIVPKAGESDVAIAIQGSDEGAKIMRSLGGYKRWEILHKAAMLIRDKQEEFARTICQEVGKTIRESRSEAARGFETLMASAEEAKRISDDTIPLDGAPGGENKVGFSQRVPCGVVVAIAPFNFPLNLVAHKVGPALAAGNSVIIKPASDAPLTSLKLVEVLLEAGLPPLAVSCITGSGKSVGEALCKDPKVRKITFTGSADVGRQICHVAGLKRVTMELGSNCPVIVLADADLTKTAEIVAAASYYYAGQTCTSTQRVFVEKDVYDDFLGLLKGKTEKIKMGDPLSEQTDLGPMIRERDIAKVLAFFKDAKSSAARILTGGKRQGTMVEPTIVADMSTTMKLFREELFGPGVAVMAVNNLDEAIGLSNDSIYGLAAGIFTKNLGAAMKFVREVDYGNLHINWIPGWRVDLMPFGGLKTSGLGKEGPKYAIREMTEAKTVVFHL